MVPTTPFYVEKSLWELENYYTGKVLEVNSKMVSGVSTDTTCVVLFTIFLTVSI